MVDFALRDRDNDALSRRLHRKLYQLFSGLLFAVVLIGWWAYGDGAYAGVTFAACALLAGAFTLFLTMLRSAEKPRRNQPPKRLQERLTGYLPIQTERMPTLHAIAEILLPAVGMVLTFIGVSLVFALVVPG